MFTKGRSYGSGVIIKASFVGSKYLTHIVFLQVNTVSSVHYIGPNHKMVTIRLAKELAIPQQNTPPNFSGIMGLTN